MIDHKAPETVPVWFYRFPDELPLPIPGTSKIKTEAQARRWIRDMHNRKRLPPGVEVWTEESEPMVRRTEATDFVHALHEMKCSHKITRHKSITGGIDLAVRLGPVDLHFDESGQFTELNWYDTGGPSNFNSEYRIGGDPKALVNILTD